MAKNKKEVKKKAYKNPASTNWGKILIGALTLAMVLGSIAMLIYYIIHFAGRV